MTDPPEWWLTAVESAKYSALKFEKRRREWLLGRWTAKRLVQAAILVETGRLAALEELEIRSNGDGVPCAEDLSGADDLSRIALSISHSRNHALCAVAKKLALEDAPCRGLGCDLEYVEPRAENFVRDYFTTREIEQVERAGAAARDLAVTCIWSAKEAALKAVQVGLSVDTRDVECLVPTLQGPLFHRAGLDSHWAPLEIGYKGALAMNAGGPHVGWWRTFGGFVVTLAVQGGRGAWMPDDVMLSPELALMTLAPAHHKQGPARPIAFASRHHHRPLAR
jgi:4'-phosphopantetheinyl transferase